MKTTTMRASKMLRQHANSIDAIAWSIRNNISDTVGKPSGDCGPEDYKAASGWDDATDAVSSHEDHARELLSDELGHEHVLVRGFWTHTWAAIQMATGLL